MSTTFLHRLKNYACDHINIFPFTHLFAHTIICIQILGSIKNKLTENGRCSMHIINISIKRVLISVFQKGRQFACRDLLAYAWRFWHFLDAPKALSFPIANYPGVMLFILIVNHRFSEILANKSSFCLQGKMGFLFLLGCLSYENNEDELDVYFFWNCLICNEHVLYAIWGMYGVSFEWCIVANL